MTRVTYDEVYGALDSTSPRTIAEIVSIIKRERGLPSRSQIEVRGLWDVIRIGRRLALALQEPSLRDIHQIMIAGEYYGEIIRNGDRYLTRRDTP